MNRPITDIRLPFEVGIKIFTSEGVQFKQPFMLCHSPASLQALDLLGVFVRLYTFLTQLWSTNLGRRGLFNLLIASLGINEALISKPVWMSRSTTPNKTLHIKETTLIWPDVLRPVAGTWVRVEYYGMWVGSDASHFIWKI